MAATSGKPTIPPTLLLFGSMISIQLGAAIAKPLIAELGPSGVVLMRLGFAGIILMLVQRPQWKDYRASDYRNMLWFAATMALMNGFYYASIARIPIGIAVTIEFLGPLGVALLHSRRRLDLIWVVLAAAGIALLTPVPGSNLDPLGVVYALIAAVGWGAYIIFSSKAGKSISGPVLPIVTSMSALFLLPLGFSSLGPTLAQPRLLISALLVALFGSVFTYTLEFAALKRMPINLFGVMLSLEPVIASIISFGVLGETLSIAAMAAIVLVSIAAAGASYSEKATT